jgi:hypothetical protein
MARGTPVGLLDSPHLCRDADPPGASDPFVPDLRTIDADRAVIEHAKGALMPRCVGDGGREVQGHHSRSRVPLHYLLSTTH